MGKGPSPSCPLGTLYWGQARSTRLRMLPPSVGKKWSGALRLGGRLSGWWWVKTAGCSSNRFSPLPPLTITAAHRRRPPDRRSLSMDFGPLSTASLRGPSNL
ncbi:hypothetical protein PCANC_02436 [Puccinia coronata f. sp. avenae]|uniref:Uncharacterized protein n=1 Tax=Puccinia coronata f. sp. avenae TaxID=200324 RepID=A0A2N5T923_9BASI|nr:hypothetical protein PCANC_04398 [Puccinia coronata f. sp. avenae]PLW57310.1 hypothetical protein PCANC_02436 [Puccinia coronata f. sp. avenae]